jgi:hypothetical protein
MSERLNSDGSGTIRVLKNGRWAVSDGKKTRYFDPSKAVTLMPGIKQIPEVPEKDGKQG